LAHSVLISAPLAQGKAHVVLLASRTREG
jgi:hypothetical protein